MSRGSSTRGGCVAKMDENDIEIIGHITNIEIIAANTSIRELASLREKYGGSRWRKLKGISYVRAEDGAIILAEVHWYECHGIGRRDMKVKRSLED